MSLTDPCTVRGCSEAHYAKGWCRRHYERALRHGSPTGGGPPSTRNFPAAFSEHAMSERRVVYLLDKGVMRAPLDERGRRTWSQREIAIGVLANRLERAGFKLDRAADLARRYVEAPSDTLRVDLLGGNGGALLRLSMATAKKVGR